MSTRNQNQIAPSPSFGEAPGTTVDKVIVTPRRNALGARSGERYAEEGLGFVGAYSGAFYSAVDAADHADHVSVEVQQAGQAQGRSRLGSGQEIPAWNAVPQEALASFQESSDGDPGRATPFPYLPRRGYSTDIKAPLVGLHRGSRQNTSYESKQAVNTARLRRNQADISDL